MREVIFTDVSLTVSMSNHFDYNGLIINPNDVYEFYTTNNFKSSQCLFMSCADINFENFMEHSFSEFRKKSPLNGYAVHSVFDCIAKKEYMFDKIIIEIDKIKKFYNEEQHLFGYGVAQVNDLNKAIKTLDEEDFIEVYENLVDDIFSIEDDFKLNMYMEIFFPKADVINVSEIEIDNTDSIEFIDTQVYNHTAYVTDKDIKDFIQDFFGDVLILGDWKHINKIFPSKCMSDRTTVMIEDNQFEVKSVSFQ